MLIDAIDAEADDADGDSDDADAAHADSMLAVIPESYTRRKLLN